LRFSAFVLAALSVAFVSSRAFASGSPVVYCDTADSKYQVYFGLSRTDEDLGDVLDHDTQNDLFSTLGQDDPQYPSVTVSVPNPANPRIRSNVAEIVLPARTQGFLSQLNLGNRSELDQLMVNVFATNLEIRIVASNKKDYSANTKMTGLMTLKVKKDGSRIKQDLAFESVKVTCQAGWE
jgi:hypothetical protein